MVVSVLVCPHATRLGIVKTSSAKTAVRIVNLLFILFCFIVYFYVIICISMFYN